ncbi:MAG: histone deacetylase [Ignavibacteria bacterium]|nr:histone deacetylase [Ignavibacteria bacterium]
MKTLFNKKFLNHNPNSFGEGAYRIRDFNNGIEETEYNGEKYLTLVHTKDYLQEIHEASMRYSLLAEVELTPESYEAALHAVGLTILASEQNDFAVVRPPGHHAKRSRADGFCFFNNIAIATQKLVEDGKKVFIIDIDGHHGDGTQSIFYDSDKVLFCSIHQQHAYPGTGAAYETGEKVGEGFTMNFPLPAGSGDEEFLLSVDKAIEKALDFKPDVVGVSAGFDGYEKDMLLNLNYTLDSYYECGRRLSESFENVFAVLEGGYHQDVRKCVDNFINGVNNK